MHARAHTHTHTLLDTHLAELIGPGIVLPNIKMNQPQVYMCSPS